MKGVSRQSVAQAGAGDDSFTKGMRVLEALALSEDPLGLTELAERCGLLKSHAHKYLKALSTLGYVVQQQERGPYRLTFKLWQLGSLALSRADLIEAARRPMQEISAQTGESATLAVYDAGDAVYIYKIEGTNAVRTHTDVGRRRPAYCVAAGKVLLASRPASDLDDVIGRIEPYTERTVRDRDELYRQLAEIRRRGYAVNWGEWTETVRGLAAPVRNAAGDVIAALNLSIPAERLDKKAVARLVPLVLGAALRISTELGYIDQR